MRITIRGNARVFFGRVYYNLLAVRVFLPFRLSDAQAANVVYLSSLDGVSVPNLPL